MFPSLSKRTTVSVQLVSGVSRHTVGGISYMMVAVVCALYCVSVLLNCMSSRVLAEFGP